MSVLFEISKILTTLATDGVTVRKLVFDMTATEVDDITGDRVAQAVIDAAIENPPAADARDIIVQYAEDQNWKQQLLDRIAVKKAAGSPSIQDLSTITTAVDDSEVPVSIFKTSVRKLKACKACRAHAENKRFPTAGEVVRAHKGCNCRIVTQTVTSVEYQSFFSASRVHDLRP